MAKARPRIPKLRYTAWRKLGWHVAFRDRESGSPREHLINIREREPEARLLFHAWVLEHVGGNGDQGYPTKAQPQPRHSSKTIVLYWEPARTCE